MKQSYSWATSTSAGPRPARRYSVSATARAGRVVSDSRISTGNWMPGWGSGMLPWATARMSAGGWARSAARSAVVTTTAQAPSVSRQKSNSRSGSEIIRAAR